MPVELSSVATKRIFKVYITSLLAEGKNRIRKQKNLKVIFLKRQKREKNETVSYCAFNLDLPEF